jgi:molybdate transport system substrate-binding protein
MGVAASLREIAETLPRAFAAATPSVEVETSFGASSALARQVELGAPIDVLVSADADLMQALATQARVVPSSIRQIATGRLVLVSRAGSPFERSGLEAFRSPHLKRVGLPSQAVPLGRYGYAWLETIGMLDVLRGKIVSTENARANLTAVDQGHVDLAILYETDFRLRPSLRVVSRPDEKDVPAIRYVAARTTRAPDCNEIDRVLDAWQSPRVRARLAKAGFGLPEEPRPARTRAAAPDAATPGEAEHR